MDAGPSFRVLAPLALALCTCGPAFAAPASNTPPVRIPALPSLPAVPAAPNALDEFLGQLRREKGVVEERVRVLLGQMGQISDRHRRETERLSRPSEARAAAALVPRLGSPKFADREAAHKALADLGAAAAAAVRAGTKDPDAEIARRCEAILPKVRVAERKALVDGTIDLPAPAGTWFRDVAGDTKEARELFALMTDDDRWAAIADAAAANPTGAANLYAAEVNRLVADSPRLVVGRRLLEETRATSLKVAPAGRVAFVLFLGALPAPDGSPDPAQVTRVLRAGFADLATGPQKAPFGRLFAAWLSRRANPTVVAAGLELALVTGLPDAVPIARRWATDPKAPAPVVGAAALVLGTHGSPGDLALLADLAADARTYRAATDTRSEVQVRDVATMMSLVLRGQNVRPFRFEPAQVKSKWGKDAGPCPYTEVEWVPGRPADRDAGRKRAWDWLDQQPDAPLRRRK
jgi:hypothetical protein